MVFYLSIKTNKASQKSTATSSNQVHTLRLPTLSTRAISSFEDELLTTIPTKLLAYNILTLQFGMLKIYSIIDK